MRLLLTLVTFSALLGCAGILGSTDTGSSSEDTGGAPAGPDRDGDGTPDAKDCDPADPSAHPGAEERCNGFDDDCDGDVDEGLSAEWYEDQDGDGFGEGQASEGCDAPEGYAAQDGDCDDADSSVYPGADESDCTDPKDYNCDGETAYADKDKDGYASCEDCNDADSKVHTSSAERCNGKDDDCNGTIDDDASDCTTLYEDADGDGVGSTKKVCGCAGSPGYASTSGDCDDTNADVNPSALETCATTYDDDCDGKTNDYTGGSAPSVYAGADQTEAAGDASCVADGYAYACDACPTFDITLGSDATATDAEGDTLTYKWTVSPSGPSIDTPTALSTRVTMPETSPTEPGACEDTSYVFTLTVTDCSGKSKADSVTITASCCGV
jgi:hypothetical protein